MKKNCGVVVATSPILIHFNHKLKKSLKDICGKNKLSYQKIHTLFFCDKKLGFCGKNIFLTKKFCGPIIATSP